MQNKRLSGFGIIVAFVLLPLGLTAGSAYAQLGDQIYTATATGAGNRDTLGSWNVTDATIQAGDPLGTLDIIGGLSMNSSSALNELLGGSRAGTGYRVLDVGGHFHLSDATPTLEDLNGFKPTNMEVFDFANANNIPFGWSGYGFADDTISFDGGTFDVSYLSGGLSSGCAMGYQGCSDLLKGAEPGTLLLLAIMLAAFVLAGPAAIMMRSKG